MPELDDPADNPAPGTRNDRVAQTDVRRNPDGIYSGMTKRLAISDDRFVEYSTRAGDTPIKNTKNTGKLKHEENQGETRSGLPSEHHSLRDYKYKRSDHT